MTRRGVSTISLIGAFSTPMPEQELRRRLDQLTIELDNLLKLLQSKIEVLENANKALGEGYTGTIYAIDSQHNTVELQVQGGKLKTAVVV